MTILHPTRGGEALPDGPRSGTRERSTTLRRYRAGITSPRGLSGLAILVVVTAASLLLPALLGLDPNEQSDLTLAGPSPSHLLGTDEVGRDLLARVLFAVRVDLLLAVSAVPIAAVLGTVLGMWAAVIRRGRALIVGTFDILLGFSGIVLGLAVTLALTPGLTAIMVTVVLVSMPSFGRLAMAATSSQLGRDHVQAAGVLGTPRHRILTSHVVPHLLDTIIVRAAVAVAAAIQIEGGLSVVGLGIQPPSPSLGSMIALGSQYLTNRPLYGLVPVLVVFLLTFGCTLVADALNKAVLR